MCPRETERWVRVPLLGPVLGARGAARSRRGVVVAGSRCMRSSVPVVAVSILLAFEAKGERTGASACASGGEG